MNDTRMRMDVEEAMNEVAEARTDAGAVGVHVAPELDAIVIEAADQCEESDCQDCD